MGRVSKGILIGLNLLTMLLSFGMIGVGIWLVTNQEVTECTQMIQWCVLGLGISTLVASLIALLGIMCKSKFLFFVYLFVLALVFLALVAFSVLGFVVAYGKGGHDMGKPGHREYQVGEYFPWLRMRVTKGWCWNKVVTCLRDSKFCKKAENGDFGFFGISNQYISPIEDGCCKPPYSCNYTYEYSTDTWKPPSQSMGFYLSNTCSRWSDDAFVLCYDCDSCRAGVLENVRITSRKAAIVSIVTTFIFFLIIILGLYAAFDSRNKKYDTLKNENEQPTEQPAPMFV